MVRVIDGTTSLARFGDGELCRCCGRAMTLFPTHHARAQRGAPQHLDDAEPRHRLPLVGLPRPHQLPLLVRRVGQRLARPAANLRTDITYGNTRVTRPRFFSRLGQRGVDLWRQVWADKSVCVVTGTGLTLRTDHRAVRQCGQRLAGGRTIDRRVRSRRRPRAATPRCSGRHLPAVPRADRHSFSRLGSPGAAEEPSTSATSRAATEQSSSVTNAPNISP